MARRGENIYKRKDGRWEGRIPNGYTESGKRKYRSIYAESYSAVKLKMKEAGEIKPVDKIGDKMLMEDAFFIWIKDKQYSWKQSTYACYMQVIQKQLLPSLGKIPVSQFNNTLLNKFISEKKNSQHENFSDAYLKSMTNIILQTLRYLKNEYQYNISVPSVVPKREIAVQKNLPDNNTMHILENYLKKNCDDSTCLGVLLCCYTGLRIGELCALCWKDIDFDNNVLHIRRTIQRVKVYEKDRAVSRVVLTVPKTRNSLRQIPLPPMIINLLKKHLGEPDEYIIKGTKASFAEPRTLQYRFQSILRQCKIESFNFHMLRHVFATRCIALGFDINSLSEILGHSSVQITLNLYVHSTNERKRSLMEQFQL